MIKNSKAFSKKEAEPEPSGRLVRPAHCAVCQKQLYYSGDPKHKPEIKVTVALPKWQKPHRVENLKGPFGICDHYIHLRCWNALPIKLV